MDGSEPRYSRIILSPVISKGCTRYSTTAFASSSLKVICPRHPATTHSLLLPTFAAMCDHLIPLARFASKINSTASSLFMESSRPKILLIAQLGDSLLRCPECGRGEAEVDQRSEVPITFRSKGSRGCVFNDGNFEALFNKLAKVALDAQIGSHPR